MSRARCSTSPRDGALPVPGNGVKPSAARVIRWDIPFAGGLRRPGAWVEREAELGVALSALGLSAPRPVLVLVGGAANLESALVEPLSRLFTALASRLDQAGAAVIDGGTAYGVMQLMGLARARSGARFPLVGVAAIGTVEVLQAPFDAACGTAALDPNHSHFILAPGVRWGDESPWISACARALAGGRPSLTLVAAGGEVTRLDLAESLSAGRPLLAVAGSGGTADRLARWWRGGGPPDGMTLAGGDRGLIQVLELEDPAAVGDLVSRGLGS